MHICVYHTETEGSDDLFFALSYSSHVSVFKLSKHKPAAWLKTSLAPVCESIIPLDQIFSRTDDKRDDYSNGGAYSV